MKLTQLHYSINEISRLAPDVLLIIILIQNIQSVTRSFDALIFALFKSKDMSRGLVSANPCLCLCYGFKNVNINKVLSLPDWNCCVFSRDLRCFCGILGKHLNASVLSPLSIAVGVGFYGNSETNDGVYQLTYSFYNANHTLGGVDSLVGEKQQASASMLAGGTVLLRLGDRSEENRQFRLMLAC